MPPDLVCRWFAVPSKCLLLKELFLATGLTNRLTAAFRLPFPVGPHPASVGAISLIRATATGRDLKPASARTTNAVIPIFGDRHRELEPDGSEQAVGSERELV